MLLTPFDLKRLDSYANNMLDYHVILDLMPTVAKLYFQKRLGEGKMSRSAEAESAEYRVRLTAVQSSILLGLGLQRKPIEELEVRDPLFHFSFAALLNKKYLCLIQAELQLPVSQTLALFAKIIRKISRYLMDIQKAAISAELPQPTISVPTAASHMDEANLSQDPKSVTAVIEQELDEAGSDALNAVRERQKEFLSSLDLKK